MPFTLMIGYLRPPQNPFGPLIINVGLPPQQTPVPLTHPGPLPPDPGPNLEPGGDGKPQPWADTVPITNKAITAKKISFFIKPPLKNAGAWNKLKLL